MQKKKKMLCKETKCLITTKLEHDTKTHTHTHIEWYEECTLENKMLGDF